ncbi:hypothetical protein [Fredinandcohnia quinoae]|uniref:Tetratricopeptide repeat protein n=1 Tax=Fredinandcohnia quinoae TaxID=2918902 RepID=A0AAW5E202_9BACI|nr:hypothetical protein [Fredinandcohnia sp. SECRCQ15]MCH1624102.1 hypothetical protein [Fredinandcohnia sp. SECRCQ15]
MAEYLDLLDDALKMADEDLARIPLLERIILEADSHNDIETGVVARFELIDTCHDTGYPKKALQAFSWLIHKYESDETIIDEEDLFWRYKWIIGYALKFPEIPIEQIETLQADMKEKFKAKNYSLKPYYYSKLRMILRMGGEIELAEPYYEKWKETSADHLSDCRACELDSEVDYYIHAGDVDKAYKLAQPLLIQRLTCSSVPHITYSYMVLSLLHIGKKEAAEKCYKKGYKLVAKRGDFAEEIGEYILYLLKTNRKQEAETILNENIEIIEKIDTTIDKIMFMQSAYPLFAEKNDVKRMNWVEEYTQKLDTRHGNGYYTTRLNEIKQFTLN